MNKIAIILKIWSTHHMEIQRPLCFLFDALKKWLQKYKKNMYLICQALVSKAGENPTTLY